MSPADPQLPAGVQDAYLELLRIAKPDVEPDVEPEADPPERPARASATTPSCPQGFQDADLEMVELARQANERKEENMGHVELTFQRERDTKRKVLYEEVEDGATLPKGLSLRGLPVRELGRNGSKPKA